MTRSSDPTEMLKALGVAWVARKAIAGASRQVIIEQDCEAEYVRMLIVFAHGACGLLCAINHHEPFFDIVLYCVVLYCMLL